MVADLLRGRREAILNRWADAIFDGYPEETARFMRSSGDRFRNPVGHTIKQELPAFFSSFLDGAPADELAGTLSRLIQIKSVQQPRASEALDFILQLKAILADEARRQRGAAEAVQGLEARIDRLLLAAFDRYQGYREKILEIKANEIRNRSKVLLERMNLGGIGDEPAGTCGSVPEGIPDAPAEENAGEHKGGND
jgi:hypothetical protein